MVSYIKIDNYVFVYVQLIFVFYQFIKKLLIHSFYLVLHFLYLRLFTLDYFVKSFVLLGFHFFTFFVYLLMFQKTAKICSKSCNK